MLYQQNWHRWIWTRSNEQLDDVDCRCAAQGDSFMRLHHEKTNFRFIQSIRPWSHYFARNWARRRARPSVFWEMMLFHSVMRFSALAVQPNQIIVGFSPDRLRQSYRPAQRYLRAARPAERHVYSDTLGGSYIRCSECVWGINGIGEVFGVVWWCRTTDARQTSLDSSQIKKRIFKG